MQNKWNISPIAYKKIVFHCLRYPSSKVYGALVSNKDKQINNVYPMFHTPLLAPSLSISLNLIESNLEPSQSIIGFYEFINEEENTPVMNRIISHQSNFKEMILAKVQVKDKQFFISIKNENIDLPDFSIVKQDLLDGQHWKIVDIDSHLEEIELDLRNAYVK